MGGRVPRLASSCDPRLAKNQEKSHQLSRPRSASKRGLLRTAWTRLDDDVSLMTMEKKNQIARVCICWESDLSSLSLTPHPLGILLLLALLARLNVDLGRFIDRERLLSPRWLSPRRVMPSKTCRSYLSVTLVALLFLDPFEKRALAPSRGR
ncbi:hypothetical protein BJV74DRAFT_113335 [Russula compacta]|nr:hypothetical protein BJV74DRAFT_113335 [Russula compacta]